MNAFIVWKDHKSFKQQLKTSRHYLYAILYQISAYVSVAFQLNEEFRKKHSLYLETFIFQESRSLYIVKHNINGKIYVLQEYIGRYAIYHEKCNTKGHTLILAIYLLHTKLYFYVHYCCEIYVKFDNSVQKIHKRPMAYIQYSRKY